ncbi:SRPBCC family protein [uncultured Ferrimonas sp.]|uniref:SRPBCC family protein n=1 Tax=uncultured Ferrimonas sp. TaxID=432640 RepID=UPI00260A3E50|nr:SRPBCC family protein [uncultured Ferrimonas sp.]
MKTLRNVLLALLLTIVAMGLLLPNDFVVQRQIQIAATPAQIHPLVDDLNQWPQWSPWLQQDPSVIITVGQPSAGVGANQRWQDNSGGGHLVITASSPETGVQYNAFFDGAEHANPASITFTEQDNGSTKVHWHMRGAFSMPIIGPYMAIAADSMIGPTFEQGLSRLKLVAEPQPSPEPALESTGQL